MKISRAVCFCLPAICLLASSAKAVDPARRISQYAHTAWRIQDGFFSGAPTAITQTRDGYLWIGTVSGLLRFDGVRFVHWAPPHGEQLLSASVYSLLAARDGSLWIGTAGRLFHWTNQTLVDFPETHGRVNSILEDRNGTLWIARSRVRDQSGPLCQVIGSRLKCFGKADGIPIDFAGSLVSDAAGNLWLGSTSILIRWRSGSVDVYPVKGLKNAEGLSGVEGLAPISGNSLWVGMNRAGPGLGLQRLVQGVWKPFATPALDGATLEVSTLFLDRDNGLWVGTTNQGIYRVYNGNVDHFRSADGLSSDSIFNFYQDREGDIWVATSKGIDSFRNLAVASFSIAEGLHADDVGSVLASRNGAVWIGNAGALDSLHEGKWFSIQRQNGLPGGKVTSLLEDRSGLLWIGVDNGLFVYEHGRFSAIRGQGGGLKGIVIAMTQDHNGDIWAELPGNPARLIRIRNRKVIETLTASQIPAAFTVMADPQDGLWVTPFEGGLARYRQDRLEMIPARGPTGAGTIYNLLADSGGTIWGAAKNALVGWRKGRIQVLSVANGLPCDHIYSIVSDSRNALWLYAQCGLITITRPELERWWAHPETTVKTRTFDVFDGVQAAPASFRPSAARSLDGRLWFANDSILQMIDPSHLEDNPVPPPVHVETIVADTKNYLPRGALRLPPLTRDIEINYTALSFVTPQRVRFRYKLEGHDAVWQEAAARRSAFYMNLSPARYRFHVIACNNDGVWNERGAVLDFTIPPAWYQTVWSKVVGLLAVCALCYLLYRRKVRQVAASLKIRFDERLEERTRLARDLHDTLIQTIQGSKMVADNAREEPDDLARMQKAVDLLAEWLGRAILEGWAALASLRSSTTEGNDLAESLRQAGDDGRIKTLIDVSVSLRGKSKEMHPIARDEVYRIGYEAIQNACAHSGGTHVSVELEYGQYLRLRVRDDGRGMDQNTLRFGKAGHFGLQGMRERAARIGGKLTLSSSQDKGTEVNLLVPGKVIFK